MAAYSATISPDFAAGQCDMDIDTKEEYKPILRAVLDGHTAELAALLEAARTNGHGTGPYLSKNYKDGCTPLHIAADLQYKRCVNAILKAAREVYPSFSEFFTVENCDSPHPSLGPYFEKDCAGKTPLLYAVQQHVLGIDNASVVKLLSEKFGAHACLVEDYTACTPLAAAVNYRNMALVEQLVMAKDKDGVSIGKKALLVPNKNGDLPHQHYSSAEGDCRTLLGTREEAKDISDYLEELYLRQTSSGALTKRAM